MIVRVAVCGERRSMCDPAPTWTRAARAFHCEACRYDRLPRSTFERWVTTYLGVHGRAICIRYDCTYAAMIASGAWKPKKHKEAAEDARRAWRAAWHSTNGRLWLQRRKQNAHALHIHVADVLASKGARGVETYAATVS